MRTRARLLLSLTLQLMAFAIQLTPGWGGTPFSSFVVGALMATALWLWVGLLRG